MSSSQRLHYPLPHLSEEVKASFLEAVKPVYDKFVPDIDAEFYSLLTATQK